MFDTVEFHHVNATRVDADGSTVPALEGRLPALRRLHKLELSLDVALRAAPCATAGAFSKSGAVFDSFDSSPTGRTRDAEVGGEARDAEVGAPRDAGVGGMAA